MPEVLEGSSIAWPNPAMWRKAPFAAMQVPTLQADDSESHAHSPQRRGSGSRKVTHTPNSFPVEATNPVFAAGGRRVTYPVCGPISYPGQGGFDPFGDAGSYFEWLKAMGMGMNTGNDQYDNMARCTVAPKSTRRTSTDISMPDYVSTKSSSQCAEQRPGIGAFPQDDGNEAEQLKVPTNTPTTIVDSGNQRDGSRFPKPLLEDLPS